MLKLVNKGRAGALRASASPDKREILLLNVLLSTG